MLVVRVWGGQYREELILNITVFVVRVWREQYREEQILNVTVFVVRVWGGQYREEQILNVTVFVVRVWGEIYREELILNATVFVGRVWGIGSLMICVYNKYFIWQRKSETSKITTHGSAHLLLLSVEDCGNFVSSTDASPSENEFYSYVPETLKCVDCG